jgi:rod shape-determining protein MreD
VKYVIAFAVAWFLSVLSVSAMPYIKVLGVTPDLVLIFAACWAVVRGQDEALIVVPVAAFLRDFATSDPIGTSVLAMAPIVVLAAVLKLRALDTNFLPALACVVTGTLAYGIISTIVLGVTGHSVDWLYAAVRVIVPAVIVNTLFAPILYLPVNWLSPRPTGLRGAARLGSAY